MIQNLIKKLKVVILRFVEFLLLLFFCLFFGETFCEQFLRRSVRMVMSEQGGLAMHQLPMHHRGLVQPSLVMNPHPINDSCSIDSQNSKFFVNELNNALVHIRLRLNYKYCKTYKQINLIVL